MFSFFESRPLLPLSLQEVGQMMTGVIVFYVHIYTVMSSCVLSAFFGDNSNQPADTVNARTKDNLARKKGWSQNMVSCLGFVLLPV